MVTPLLLRERGHFARFLSNFFRSESHGKMRLQFKQKVLYIALGSGSTGCKNDFKRLCIQSNTWRIESTLSEIKSAHVETPRTTLTTSAQYLINVTKH